MIRFGRQLSLVLWIGGVAFFAFVVAPVAFGTLAKTHDAGLVVGGALRALHLLGIACGTVFLILTASGVRSAVSRRALVRECALIFAMLFVTVISQWAVLPAMERLRAEMGGDVRVANASSLSRMKFDRLHRWSEWLEGGVLGGGLIVLFFVATEGDRIVPTW